MMLNTWFLLPALVLILSVLALAPLGAEVLRRGVVFVDLALAQAAAAATVWLGVYYPAAHLHPIWKLGITATGACLAAFLVAAIARRWPAQREALIGLLYVFCAALAVLGARLHPHGQEELIALLAADVLWASRDAAWQMALCASLVLTLHYIRPLSLRKDAVFYPLFALAVSLAVPALGLFLVFAALITPALWVHGDRPLWLALGISISFALGGLALSWLYDAPSGACIALSLSLSGLCSVLFGKNNS